MKRLIRIMACILSALFFTISSGAYSVDGLEVRDENGDIVNHEGGHFQRFEKADGTLIITDFTDTIVVGKLVVPSEINGRKVTEIKAYSFGHVEAMTSLTIPGSVTYVGKGAFQNCRDLETVVIERGTEILDERVFAGCEVLSSIIIPDSITEFGAGIFEGCPPHMMIYYEGTVDEWRQIKKDDSEFENIAVTFALSELPDDVMEEYVVSGEYSYRILRDGTAELTGYSGKEKNVVIPTEIDGYTVSGIGEKCFYFNIDIISVDIPYTVKSVGNRAFYLCTSMEEVTLPEGLEIIDESAFGACGVLESVTLPSTVAEIRSAAFQSCYALKEVTIPDSVTVFSDRVFQNCTSLEKVVIGKNITKIEEYTFDECCFLRRIEIPENVFVLGCCSFKQCDRLEEIVIHSSLERIERSAFVGCNSLEKVYYSGSSSLWDKIIVESNNKPLNRARVVYNYNTQTYRESDSFVAIILCSAAALVPVVVAVIFIIRRKKVCPDCGKKIEDNSKFCGGCGREL
ncbi:MAG: leucine-rich repeat protein [Ruminiclostridium sp.]|nr:leucine-rich repeat protein [Ruminiclostridium sp.]